MRPIDADALVENIKRVYCTDCDNYGGVRCRACGTADALDMVDGAPTALTEKEILSLRAVAYGANTNKKLVAGFFTVYNDDRSVKEMIPFDEAIETVYKLLDKIMEVNEE
jgi:hypothetical protein